MKRSTAFLITLIVLLLSIPIFIFTTVGRLNPELPVKDSLPHNLPQYDGFSIWHCQNEDCLRSFIEEDLTNTVTCPVCGGKLDQISLAEYRLLPDDTAVIHRSYKSRSGMTFAVSVVISKYERRSIHKPQRCLVAQGHVINGQKIIKVKLDNGKMLDVMLMDVNRGKIYYAYWLTDGKVYTARHISRFFHYAVDSIIHNERRRWAYVSVVVTNNRSTETLPELKEFIKKLYPKITK